MFASFADGAGADGGRSSRTRGGGCSSTAGRRRRWRRCGCGSGPACSSRGGTRPCRSDPDGPGRAGPGRTPWAWCTWGKEPPVLALHSRPCLNFRDRGLFEGIVDESLVLLTVALMIETGDDGSKSEAPTGPTKIVIRRHRPARPGLWSVFRIVVLTAPERCRSARCQTRTRATINWIPGSRYDKLDYWLRVWLIPQYEFRP